MHPLRSVASDSAIQAVRTVGEKGRGVRIGPPHQWRTQGPVGPGGTAPALRPYPPLRYARTSRVKPPILGLCSAEPHTPVATGTQGMFCRSRCSSQPRSLPGTSSHAHTSALKRNCSRCTQCRVRLPMSHTARPGDYLAARAALQNPRRRATQRPGLIEHEQPHGRKSALAQGPCLQARFPDSRFPPP